MLNRVGRGGGGDDNSGSSRVTQRGTVGKNGLSGNRTCIDENAAIRGPSDQRGICPFVPTILCRSFPCTMTKDLRNFSAAFQRQLSTPHTSLLLSKCKPSRRSLLWPSTPRCAGLASPRGVARLALHHDCPAGNLSAESKKIDGFELYTGLRDNELTQNASARLRDPIVHGLCR